MTDQRSANRYFAAANTQDGFISFFDDIFFNDRIEKRYIIKGGPGTGKSSFLRRIALKALRQNRNIEYYYCSSDTDSLDGIVIDGSIALFDGTAPHSYDTVLPGVVDEIVNLGEFWNADELRRSNAEIRLLATQKKQAYEHAYGYLRSAGELENTMDSILDPCIKAQKMQAAVNRMITRLGVGGENGELKVNQTSAFGVKGHVHFDTLESNSKQKFYVEDYYGTASKFLQVFADTAISVGARVNISLCVPSTKKISEIYLPDTGDYICAVDKCENDGISVNMKRFVDADALSAIRFSYRVAKQAKDKIMDLAEQSLIAAGNIHSNIEQFYISAMDFPRLEAYCSEFLKKI